MAATITHEDAVRVAKQIFRGLTEENIVVEPQSGGRWRVTVTFNGSPAKIYVWDPGLQFLMADADPPIDTPFVSFQTTDGLRRFLEACRDSLVRNLEALLAVALGPVRVLPRDDALDGMQVPLFCTEYVESAGGGVTSVERLLDAYTAEVACRRAAASAKDLRDT